MLIHSVEYKIQHNFVLRQRDAAPNPAYYKVYSFEKSHQRRGQKELLLKNYNLLLIIASANMVVKKKSRSYGKALEFEKRYSLNKRRKK